MCAVGEEDDRGASRPVRQQARGLPQRADVIRVGCVEAVADRRIAAGPVLRRDVAEAVLELADRSRVLVAGVVRRHDHGVGVGRGRRAHQRALVGVSIAAAPEHDDDLPARQGAGRRQHVLEALGLYRLRGTIRYPKPAFFQKEPA